MGSWEEIADEIAPLGERSGGLVTGAGRASAARTSRVLPVKRTLACPPVSHGNNETIWGGREESNSAGSYCLIEAPLLRYDDQSRGLAQRLDGALNRSVVEELFDRSIGDLLFFDIETTGLSASQPLFLIGTLRFSSEEPTLKLLLARNLEEEAAVLAAFGKSMRGKTLVTFNGQSFDWPFVQGRARRLGVALPRPHGHFDLLLSARRRWRSRLPNCRLQTLERGICGRGREGDIPSSEIPGRYYHFLRESEQRGGGGHLLAPVLFHNALDVMTMAELICHLAEGA